MKHFLQLILLSTFFSCSPRQTASDIKIDSFSDIVSADSVNFVLLTKDFPSEGWDYEDIDGIPLYFDSIFSCWTDNKKNIGELLNRFPTIEDTLNAEQIRESCNCHGDHNKFLFFCKNSIVEISETHNRWQIWTPSGYFAIKDTFNFVKLKQLLNRKAFHKQRFDTTLTANDKYEINLYYNKSLVRNVFNGVGESLTPVLKTSWYSLK